MSETATPLTIYKASAGSGKTFTLAVEYIKLLIVDPENYRYILAVTFTNKATDEMKTRILEKLYDIANLPSGANDDYLNRLLADLGPNAEHPLPEAMLHAFNADIDNRYKGNRREAIKARAAKALHNILHNYTYFRIVTIDTFFQSVVRNLAHELGLPANMQVTLNDAEVEQRAVDNIIDSVGSNEGKGNDGDLFQWLLSFARQKIEDKKNWNFIGSVKEFGTNIFKEIYQENQEKLAELLDNNPQFFDTYITKLKSLRDEADKSMAEAAAKFHTLCEQSGVTPEMFSSGTNKNGKLGGVPGYFYKLDCGNYYDPKFSTKTIEKFINNAETMVPKTSRKRYADQLPAIEGLIHDHLATTEERRKQAAMTRLSVDLTLANINELQLLRRIEQEVRRLHAEAHTHPLSSTQRLIKGMHMGKDDAPFIYEKIGGVLKFIMIDEFQDTSSVQWENFKVLMEECLSKHVGSLIVGDVKQSIYRWRNGNWELLHDLHNDPALSSSVTTLDTNYRSAQNVIEFNNAFFQIASRLVYEEAADSERHLTDERKQEALKNYEAYQDVVQKVKPSNLCGEGSVAIRLINKDNATDEAQDDGDNDGDGDDGMLREVETMVRNLLAVGTPQRRIAVLVRTNGQINALANHFLQHPLEVEGQRVCWVSDEAFRLDASLAVTTIVNAMRLLLRPDDTLLMATLVKAGQRVSHADTPVDDRPLLVELGVGKSAGAADDRRAKAAEMNRRLAARLNGFTQKRAQLLAMPLVDMAETIYQQFQLEKLEDQSAYVCAFFDHLAAFTENRAGTLEEFVEEWDSVIAAKSIHSSDEEGIRLLTVHKSKGLEFDHVIMPYCDWALEMNGSTLWVTPPVAPYNALPLVPLKLYASKLRGSVYADLYESEHLKNVIDNLNILYVAFTRAKKNLYIIGYQGKRINWPSQLLQKFMHQTDSVGSPLGQRDNFPADISLDTLLPGYELDEDTMTFTYGDAPVMWTDEDIAAHKANNEAKAAAAAANKQSEAPFNVFRQPEEAMMVAIKSYEQHGDFRQSNASDKFVRTDKEKEDAAARETYIHTGNILHELFSMITDISEVEQAVTRLRFDGTLNGRHVSADDLLAMIERKMDNPTVAKWFQPTGQWQVFNECSILTHDDQGRLIERRPDRVMRNESTREINVIDFKNASRRMEEKYISQVREYMALLHEMHPDCHISGYLWYIMREDDAVVEVKP